MAKNPFWLRGARGKIAGAVAQKSEVGTILRERVDPSNPRTGGQLRQRVVFGTVTQAAKMMLPIIGISFEGITKEKLNRRRFVQLNSTFFGQKARIEQTNPGTTKTSWTGKGNNQLIPNEYIISRGSLSFPWSNYVTVNSSGFDVVGAGEVTIPFGTYTPLELWKLVFGAAPGAQFTFPYITTKDGANYAMEVGSENQSVEDIIRYSQFWAPRVVLLEDDSSLATLTFNSTTSGEQVMAFLSTAIDRSKSDVMLADEIVSIAETTVTTDSSKTMAFYFDAAADLPAAGYTLMALAIIYSERDENGVWKYTNSNMVCNWHVPVPITNGDQFNRYYGLSLENAMDSYRTTQQRKKNYLQTGGDGGNI